MVPRPYAAAKRTLTFADKLLDVFSAGDAPEFKPAYVIRGLKDLQLAF